MKISFAIFKYFPHGGLQSDFRRIVTECVNRGHEVIIYAGAWEGPEIPGTTLRKVPVRGWTNHARAKSFERRLPAMRGGDADAVLVGFNRMAGLDVYFAADNCFALESAAKAGWRRWFTRRYRVYEAMERAVFAEPSRTMIMHLTERQKEDFRACYGTPEKRFRRLPPEIDPNRARPASEAEAAAIRAETRTEFRLHANDRLLLQVCSGFATKGVDRTLRALASLPENLRRRTLLLIVGRETSGRFQRLAHRLHIADRVVFTGPRDDIGRLLLGADLMVHPARKEATGTVLAEAVAAGLPVLCSGNCGYAHLVREAGGIVLPEPFDANVLHRELLGVLEHPQRLREWQAAAQKHARKVHFQGRAATAANVIEGCAR